MIEGFADGASDGAKDGTAEGRPVGASVAPAATKSTSAARPVKRAPCPAAPSGRKPAAAPADLSGLTARKNAAWVGRRNRPSGLAATAGPATAITNGCRADGSLRHMPGRSSGERSRLRSKLGNDVEFQPTRYSGSDCPRNCITLAPGGEHSRMALLGLASKLWHSPRII